MGSWRGAEPLTGVDRLEEGRKKRRSVGEGGVSSSVVGWSFTEDGWSEVVCSLSAVEVVKIGLVGWSLSVSRV